MTVGTQVDVGIGQVEFLRGDGILQARGLGSCIGLVMYHKQSRSAGMAHVFLDQPKKRRDPEKPGKFATTAVPYMLRKFSSMGINSRQLQAYMAGGATLFKFNTPDMDVGRRNVTAVRSLLKKEGIPLLLDDTGGEFGRSVTFDVAQGRVEVVTLNRNLSL